MDNNNLLTGAQLSASIDAPANTAAAVSAGGHAASTKPKRKPNRMTAAEVEALVREASTDSRPPSRTDKEMPPPPPKVTSPVAENAPDISDELSDSGVEEDKKTEVATSEETPAVVE